MRINRLEIINFRAIKSLTLENLKQTVVIAGPNGSGKSCIFDSIRLLKSVYGGYQQDEVSQWFQEFQIRPNRLREDLPRLLQDKSNPLIIEAIFELSPHETAFLEEEAEKIMEHELLKQRFQNLRHTHYKERPIAPEILTAEREVAGEARELAKNFKAELSKGRFKARLEANTDGEIFIDGSGVLQTVFSLIEPDNLGVIDFHGASRNYAREAVGGINLNLESEKRNYRQHMLYNYSNKYSNVKQEMAGEFVRDILSKEATKEIGNCEPSEKQSLIETLKELFSVFFPGKEFLGPVPNSNGTLDFPVKMADGATHDINDLSSGEKEVLYGYLRLRNTAPKDSIILLDEPELHLNPRLISGLPKFYHQHLGVHKNNQMWLVTHSDEFLRNAVGEKGFSVFHMQSLATVQGKNQSVEIEAGDQLDSAILALVGDLATYGPNKNVVIFEGENSEFDLTMTKRLFPEFMDVVTAISAGSKHSVRKLHSLMNMAANAGNLKVKFFSITDSDGEVQQTSQTTSHAWDVYHIENYLLVTKYITKALDDLSLGKVSLSEEDVEQKLIKCAQARADALVRHSVLEKVNTLVLNTFSLGIDPSSSNLAFSLHDAAIRSSEKLSSMLSNGELSPDTIATLIAKKREEIDLAIDDGSWKQKVRGRDILKELCNETGIGISYEILRNTILANMVSDGYEPAGMKSVLDSIINQC